jgi:nickel-dependent lactate racemase
VVIPDITRALPNERLLGWLFRELEHVPAKRFTILSGTGTHRANTEAEWIHMVGEEIYRNYRCVDHVCTDASQLELVGHSSFGYPVHLNRRYVEADRRIILGFIEPHFMAGFSGGYKAVLPGLAGEETIMNYHSAENIGDPMGTWGVIEGNPTQAHIRAGGSLVPVDFCINVTLDAALRITGFFCGDVLPAHEAGCEFCKRTAMIACEHEYPIVITSNSGYPLDQNLYQCVKGMSAASQIVSKGGLILMAGACNDGFPEHGNFRRMLESHEGPTEMLQTILQPGYRCCDQWQVQILANILLKARVGLFSGMTAEDVQKAHLIPVPDIGEALQEELEKLGQDAPVAILPEGPLTIPYLHA